MTYTFNITFCVFFFAIDFVEVLKQVKQLLSLNIFFKK